MGILIFEANQEKVTITKRRKNASYECNAYYIYNDTVCIREMFSK